MRKRYIGISIFLIVLAIFLMLNIREFTGKAIDTYWKDFKLYDCKEDGQWDQEKQNFKLTGCSGNAIMKGVTIGVTDDALSGGRAYCCQAGIELYDCQEEEYWEQDNMDLKMTICPVEKPIMKGIGIKVKSYQQAGGKAYCCKARDVELYSCAITSYWKGRNKDYEFTYCPEDRQILGGVGFDITKDNLGGGKAYCCKAKIKVESGVVEEEVEGVEVVEENVSEEEIIEKIKEENVENVGRILTKLFCKVLYRDKEKYRACIGK